MDEFAKLDVAEDNSNAGDELAIATAATALAQGDAVRCLSALSKHVFAHWPWPSDLLALWERAQLHQERAKLGRPLTAIDRKRVRNDRARAPPTTLGAFNRPSFTGPANVHWPRGEASLKG